MTGLPLLVVGFLVLSTLVHVVADLLNLRRMSPALPAALSGLVDPETYRRSQLYLRDTTRFSLLTEGIRLLLLVPIVLSGALPWLDQHVRALTLPPVATGLAFFGILGAFAYAVGLPFSIWDTFVIEARHGFNRTTARTFAADQLKSIALILLIGTPLLAGILALFLHGGPYAWLAAWLVVTGFQLLMTLLAPVLIMPLFNRFTPLPEGELRTAIETYLSRAGLPVKGVYTMDGSRRSAKTNAFFTGLGRSRRVVLYDTLIARHTVPELVAVVAHEAGHCRRRHVPLLVALSVASSGVLFGLFSRFLLVPGWTGAFGFTQGSVHAALACFALLYTPVSEAISVAVSAVSRRLEFAADAFVAASGADPKALGLALRKLALDNLSNLTPHPFKVALEYSHPPLLRRLQALESPPAEAPPTPAGTGSRPHRARAIPAVLYMGLIFYLSSGPAPQAAGDWPILFGFKTSHMTEFAILALLWWWALSPWPARRRAAAALAITMAWGMGDEIHQSFVPTRTPAAMDALSDTLGGTLALAVAWGLSRCRRRSGRQRPVA